MRRPMRLMLGALAVGLTASFLTMAPGPGPRARAEACATTGYQPRVLVTDDAAYQETQFCFDGEWTTVSRFQLTPEYSVITETVTDPRADEYRFSSAADFFDLKNYDPYKAVEVFRDLIEAGSAVAADEKTRMRLELALIRSQAVVSRSDPQRDDRCETRSRLYSLAAIYSGLGWDPPESTGFPDQPTQIDFEFAPNVTSQVKAAILNAIGQYELAVSSQDAAFRYPQRIVPHDPADARPPTITFTSDSPHGKANAETAPDPIPRWPGERRQWTTGQIVLGATTTPQIVGHEIGHVLGMDHMPDFGRVMYPNSSPLASNGSPWDVSTPPDERASVAFDPCMFRPAENPVY